MPSPANPHRDLLPDRASELEIASSHRAVTADPKIRALIDAVTDILLILNDRRQIVAVNRSTLDALSLPHAAHLLGLRPGEAFKCVHATEVSEGCGGALHCTTCGAVNAIITAQASGKPHTQECRLTFGRGAAIDLEVVTAPLVIESENYYVCTLKDISARKRREVLEKVFLHDVINTAGGIYGLATTLVDCELPREQDVKYKQWMQQLAARLIEEIKLQGELLAAERDEFVPYMTFFPVSRLFADIEVLFANHDVAAGKTLRVEGARDGSILSDEGTVRRILGNLVKNAFEATAPGETVTLSCQDLGAEVRFSVHNREVMPEKVRLQIFQRSFSTKGVPGRGIGTYSVKLFGEKYLRGRVAFTSEAPHGTTFTFTLAKALSGEISGRPA